MLDSGEVSDGRNGCMQNDRLGVEAVTEDAEEAVRV